MKKENISRWINTVLVTVLIAIMSTSVSRQAEINRNAELLQIQLAVVTTKLENHIEFSEDLIKDVNHNTETVHDLKVNYVTREEIRSMLDDMKEYIKEHQ